METLLQDVRYALSTLRRNRGFAVAGLLTLALGIGATTAVFCVVYGVLLRPMPYPDSDRIVRLSEEHPGAVSPLTSPMLSNLTYYAWARPRTVEQLAAYRYDEFTVSLHDGGVRLAGARVTPSLFVLLGQSPAAGRFFVAAEGREGADKTVVLSDRVWHERFDADPSVVGRVVTIDGEPQQIVGIARPGFYFPDRDTLLWTPMWVPPPSPDAVAGKQGRLTVVNALARLRPGVETGQAEAEGTAAARTTIRPMAATLLFGAGGPPVVHVRGLVEEMTANIRPALVVLAAAVVCVLLIACANVANLFLSRGVARQRELTVRAAIGASRTRLTRQLLTESAVLSTIGGALGLGLAWALVRLVPVVASADFPRIRDIAIDVRVVAFTAAATIVTALISGMAPALRGARFDLAESLHGGDGATAGGFRGRRARRLRDGLLVAESAFAVVLLVAAMLLARSFVRLTHVDAGYTPQHVLAAEIYVPGGDAPERAEAMQVLVNGILDRTRATAGVVAAGASNMMPLDASTLIAGFQAPWTRSGREPAIARSLQYMVTPGYAEALSLRLKSGRLFAAGDASSGLSAWIVNEEFARHYLPREPVGYRWTTRGDDPSSTRLNEIIGIVANTLKGGNDKAVQAEHYQMPGGNDLRFSGRFEIAARTTGDPAAIAPAIRNIVRELAPSAAVETVTMSQRVAASVDQPRFAMTVLVSFAALALALASVGLYGVLSYAVSQRRRELGLRAALGASRGAIVRQVIREGLSVTVMGLLVGLAGAAAVTRLMNSVLFGVTPLDPLSFAFAPLLLVPIALLACAVPALRAARTDPAQVLRYE